MVYTCTITYGSISVNMCTCAYAQPKYSPRSPQLAAYTRSTVRLTSWDPSIRSHNHRTLKCASPLRYVSAAYKRIDVEDGDVYEQYVYYSYTSPSSTSALK